MNVVLPAKVPLLLGQLWVEYLGRRVVVPEAVLVQLEAGHGRVVVVVIVGRHLLHHGPRLLDGRALDRVGPRARRSTAHHVPTHDRRPGKAGRAGRRAERVQLVLVVLLALERLLVLVGVGCVRMRVVHDRWWGR